MDVGSYCGFNIRIEFQSFYKVFDVSLKGESVVRANLGSDALGNITRINNLLEGLPKKLEDAKENLENVKLQMENAKEELAKPFPKEQELNEKLERLSQLNALLDMDATEEEINGTVERESEKPSIHDRLSKMKEQSGKSNDSHVVENKRTMMI